MRNCSMAENEASAYYPNDFIIMQMDSMDLSDDAGNSPLCG